jgi:hypothetical protein
MKSGSLQNVPVRDSNGVSFHGPFLSITACLEKDGERKDRWCLLFLTPSSLVVMPVPADSLKAEPGTARYGPAPGLAKRAPGALSPRYNDAGIRGQLNGLMNYYLAKDPEEVITGGSGTQVIPRDTISGILITWVRSSGRYSRLLFFFGFFPAEPANAGYHVMFQLAISAGTEELILTTPFSPELRNALRELLGERVREIPDAYAPLL